MHYTYIVALSWVCEAIRLRVWVKKTGPHPHPPTLTRGSNERRWAIVLLFARCGMTKTGEAIGMGGLRGDVVMRWVLVLLRTHPCLSFVRASSTFEIRRPYSPHLRRQG
ncbi:hypothetical protein I4U23_011236 [Adineta vaga]|nr:hypothetical protein I4U23_011236 [Adineta vaga]